MFHTDVSGGVVMGRVLGLALLGVVAVPLAFAVLAGYLGAVHPLGDSLALFRPYGALGLGLCGLLLVPLRAWRAAVLALCLSLWAGLPVLAMVWPGGQGVPQPEVRVYVKNLMFGRGDTEALLADIRAQAPDLLLIQELNATRGVLMEAVTDSHPYRHICQFSQWSGIAIVSRWPLSEPHCSEHRSLAVARVSGPEGTFWAISTHLLWPYPHGQRHALEHELGFLRSLEGDVIMAGDFNMAPWGQSVRDMAEATGTARHGPLHVTIRPRGLPLAIDHVLSTGEGQTLRRPRFGSDHYGLVADIAF